MNRQNYFFCSVFAIYFSCFLFRCLEYFFIRTDYTVFGEAFIHKIIGIVILCCCAHLFSYDKSNIGFAKTDAFKKLCCGLCLGAFFYSLSYISESFVLKQIGNFKGFELYVSSYSVNGNIGNHKEAFFFLICIIGNIINVIMEEGVFRGLFQKLLEQKYKFLVSAVIASALFGVWHIVGPVRSYMDGLSNSRQLIVSIAILVFSSALVGFKYALLTKLSGSVYLSMGEHFVNNTIINVLHVISNTGTDELQILRICIAQSVSFVVVLVFYVLFAKRFIQRRNT